MVTALLPAISAEPARKVSQAKPAATKAGKSEGLRFSQICKTVGSQEITMTPRAIKVRHLTSGMVAVMREPFDKIVFFNSGSKKTVTVPLDKFRSPYNYTWTMMYTRRVTDIPLGPPEKCTYQDVAAIKYKSTASFARSQLEAKARREIPGRATRDFTYIISESFKTEPKQNKFLQLMYGLPILPGLPVDALLVDVVNDPKHYLSTSTIKKLAIDDHEFDVPTGLSTVKKVEEVCSDMESGGIELFGDGHER